MRSATPDFYRLPTNVPARAEVDVGRSANGQGRSARRRQATSGTSLPLVMCALRCDAAAGSCLPLIAVNNRLSFTRWEVGLKACRILSVALAVGALGGCETLGGSSTISSDVMLEATSGRMMGAVIRRDLTEDLLGAQMYRYRVVNNSPVPVCASVRLISTSAANYSFSGAQLVQSGNTVELGYQDDGGTVEYDLWAPNASGVCGYPPG